MGISYKPLWYQMVDRGMKKLEFRDYVDIRKKQPGGLPQHTNPGSLQLQAPFFFGKKTHLPAGGYDYALLFCLHRKRVCLAFL